MKTEDQVDESQRLRRMLWSTLLGEPGSAALAEEVLVPLLAEYEVVRMSLAWWRLAPNDRSERVRRSLLVDACMALDVYDTCAAAYIARLVHELSVRATPSAVAHVYTVQYLWRSMTSWPIGDTDPRVISASPGH